MHKNVHKTKKYILHNNNKEVLYQLNSLSCGLQWNAEIVSLHQHAEWTKKSMQKLAAKFVSSDDEHFISHMNHVDMCTYC